MPKRKQPKRDLCHGWADGTCTCAIKWRLYQDAPLEAFADPGAAVILAATLACVRERCPDAKARAHATVQLMHPVFADYTRRALQ